MKTKSSILAIALTCLIGAQAAPLPVSAVRKDADGVTLKLSEGTLKLRVFSPKVVEVIYAPGDALPTNKSLVVITPPQKTKWKLFETKAEVLLRTDELAVRVQRATGAVSFFDQAGQPILKENADRLLIPTEVGGITTLRSQQGFVMGPDEAYYGLGQHPDAAMNYRWQHVRLLQENTKVAVPVVVSSKGYGIFWDNPAVTDVNFGVGEEMAIPAAQLFDEDGRPGGLTGRYYLGQNFNTPVRTNVDAGVAFDWTRTPSAGLPHDNYSVRWTGSVEAKQAGEYTFVVTADDGMRLWIDDQLVINDWNSRAAKTMTARLALAANSRHRIRLEYYQNSNDATVKLAWCLPLETPVMTWKSEAADAVDYYFIYGPELDQVIAGYRDLSGAAPMFGKWAWGFWQSRERYKTQSEILDIVSGYRQRGIPFDGIIQDWQYWTPLNQQTAEGGWGSHEFDPDRYPDPAGMVKAVHAQNAHLMVVSWAKFDVTDRGVSIPNLKALEAVAGAYDPAIPYVWPPGRGKWYDPFNDQARKVYWQLMSQKLFSLGVDAWWLDASEAELSGRWGEFRNFKTAQGSGAKVFNAYPLEHTRAVFEGQRAETSAKRVLLLTRSAYAGQQRNAAITWSGDIGSRWDVLQQQIPAGLNFTVSGIPYWNTDIGGFFGNRPSDPKYVELFTRWFQFGAFCPMFRVHGTDDPKEVWRFDAATQVVLTNYINLRYHLIPYIYSVSWMVTHAGYTMMRPLVMDFRNDSQAFGVSDQFMFGPALMACPVTTAGATSRSVYLPTGTTWYDFWTGQSHAGGQTIAAASPIDTMPIYVRAGSILPYGPALQYALEKSDPIELRVYRGADGSFALYEDEGDNYRYEQGVYATIPITWSEAKQTLTLGKRRGEFPGMLKERSFRIVWVSPSHGTGVATVAKPDVIIRYTGRTVNVSAK